jgi:hypothetical protein
VHEQTQAQRIRAAASTSWYSYTLLTTHYLTCSSLAEEARPSESGREMPIAPSGVCGDTAAPGVEGERRNYISVRKACFREKTNVTDLVESHRAR